MKQKFDPNYNSFLDRYIYLGIFLLFLISPFIFSPQTYDNFLIPKRVFLQIILSFLLLIWVISIIRLKKIIIIESPFFFLGSICFLVIILISSLISSKNIHQFPHDLITFLSFLSFFPILLFNNIKLEKYKILINLIALTSLISAIYGILQYFNIDIFIWKTYMEKPKIHGVFGNPNFLSNYLIIVFPLTLSLLLKESILLKRILFLSITTIIFICVLLSETRGAWIGLLFSTLIFLYLFKKYPKKDHFKNRRYLISLLLIIFFIIFIVSFFSSSSLEKRAFSLFNFQDKSIKWRMLTWKITLRMIQDNPFFGFGIGGFKSNYLRYYKEYAKDNSDEVAKYGGENAKRVHNEYLQILNELGIVGFLLFLFLLIIIFKEGFYVLKKTNSLLVLGLLCGLVSGLTHAIFSFPFHLPVNGLLLIFIIAFILKHKEIILEKQREIYLNKPIKIVLVSISLIISFLGLKYSLDLYFLDVYMNKAYKSSDNRLNKTIYWYRKALLKYPDNKEIYLLLGDSYLKLGKHNKAIDLYKKALPIFANSSLYNNMGIAYANLERYKEAERCFEEAIIFRPDSIEILLNLLNIYNIKKRYEKSIILCERFIKYRDNNYEVKMILGSIYYKNKEYEKALRIFKDIIKINPKSVKALGYIGLIYLNKGLLDKAEKIWLKALSISPKDERILRSLKMLREDKLILK